jgi:hypothetical protein
MAKPWIHSMSSAKQFGGDPEDYLEIHEFMDSSKSVIADNRHRALTHNSWFVGTVLPRVFGEVFERRSDGKKISTRDIGEQHCLEDFAGRFIPTPQDYIEGMEMKEWMNNGRGGDNPPSYRRVTAGRVKRSFREFGELVESGN